MKPYPFFGPNIQSIADNALIKGSELKEVLKDLLEHLGTSFTNTGITPLTEEIALPINTATNNNIVHCSKDGEFFINLVGDALVRNNASPNLRWRIFLTNSDGTSWDVGGAIQCTRDSIIPKDQPGLFVIDIFNDGQGAFYYTHLNIQ